MHFRSGSEQSLQKWFLLPSSSWKQLLQQTAKHLSMQVFQFNSCQSSIYWFSLSFYLPTRNGFLLVKDARTKSFSCEGQISCCFNFVKFVENCFRRRNTVSWFRILRSSLLGHSCCIGTHVCCHLRSSSNVFKVLSTIIYQKSSFSILKLSFHHGHFRAQFSDNNRSIFNTPNPRLMNASLLKGIRNDKRQFYF